MNDSEYITSSVKSSLRGSHEPTTRPDHMDASCTLLFLRRPLFPIGRSPRSRYEPVNTGNSAWRRTFLFAASLPRCQAGGPCRGPLPRREPVAPEPALVRRPDPRHCSMSASSMSPCAGRRCPDRRHIPRPPLALALAVARDGRRPRPPDEAAAARVVAVEADAG
jgi:hypothetical protein